MTRLMGTGAKQAFHAKYERLNCCAEKTPVGNNFHSIPLNFQSIRNAESMTNKVSKAVETNACDEGMPQVLLQEPTGTPSSSVNLPDAPGRGWLIIFFKINSF